MFQVESIQQSKCVAPQRVNRLLTEESAINRISEAVGEEKKYVFASLFLHRNDETGKKVGSALLQAVEKKGAEVLVIKDKLGAVYEYAEEGGQSFWHDNPYEEPWSDTHSAQTFLWQARMIRLANREKMVRAEKNPFVQKLLSQEGFLIHRDKKRYDHSKVVELCGRLFVGDTNVGNDFHREEDGGKVISYTVETTDPRLIRDYQRTKLGSVLPVLQDGDTGVLTEERLHREGSSLQQYFLKFIRGTEHKLVIEMAYLGNPEIIEVLVKILKAGREVEIITSERGNIHRARNWHFLKTLRRKCNNSDNLRIYASPKRVHAKAMVRDGRLVSIGSANLSMGEGVMNETNLLLDDPELIRDLESQIELHKSRSRLVTALPSWGKIIIPSRVDWLSVSAQDKIVARRRESVEAARTAARIDYGALLERCA